VAFLFGFYLTADFTFERPLRRTSENLAAKGQTGLQILSEF
jgi:hypothetical protein